MKYKQVSQYRYITEDGRSIKRKFLNSAFPDEAEFNGQWCLMNKDGKMVDYDHSLDDLAARHNLVEGSFGINEEPVPPLKDSRVAGHHWLDRYDIDGHFHQRIVLQWNPGAKRWSHSGDVGTGVYVNTQYWRYVAPCPIPE